MALTEKETPYPIPHNTHRGFLKNKVGGLETCSLKNHQGWRGGGGKTIARKASKPYSSGHSLQTTNFHGFRSARLSWGEPLQTAVQYPQKRLASASQSITPPGQRPTKKPGTGQELDRNTCNYLRCEVILMWGRLPALSHRDSFARIETQLAQGLKLAFVFERKWKEHTHTGGNTAIGPKKTDSRMTTTCGVGRQLFIPHRLAQHKVVLHKDAWAVPWPNLILIFLI